VVVGSFHPARSRDNANLMEKSTRDNTNNASPKMGRRKRPEQTGVLIGVRLQPADLAALDAWIAERVYVEHIPMSRPEAIRRILREAISGN
jgi:hypothetical protein